MRIARLLLIGLLALGAAGEGADDEAEVESKLKRVPATRVYMARPDGFVQSQNFSGYESVKGRSLIMVNEAPAPLADLLATYSDEKLAAGGYQVLSREDVKVDRRPGQLIVARQKSRAGERRSWFLIFGNKERSVLIAASCNEKVAETQEPEFRSTLLGVRWLLRGSFDPFEGLGFGLRAETTLHFAMRTGSEVTFTEDGALPVKTPEHPALIVKVLPEEVPEDKRQRFCIAELEQPDILKDSKTIAANAVLVDGLPGCEALAQGTEIESGAFVSMYHAALFAQRKTYLFKGRFGVRLQDPWLGQFRSLVAGFRRQ